MCALSQHKRRDCLAGMARRLPYQSRNRERVGVPNLIRSEVPIFLSSKRGPPMSVQLQIASNVWRLLEELYLDSADEKTTAAYASADEIAKRPILKDFARRQSATSKRWSQILQNLLSAELDGWRKNP
jgi:hypothetical protein